MYISPVSHFNAKLNNIQNAKTNTTSFKSGYSLVGTPYGSSRPIEDSDKEWREKYGCPLPPLGYFIEVNRLNGTGYGSTRPQIDPAFRIDHGRFHFRNLGETPLSNIANELHQVSTGEMRDFLFEANVEEKNEYKQEPSYKHISHYFKNMIKDEGDKWVMKGLVDRAISEPAWAEDGSHVAANSAYLIHWYKDCLPESTKAEYDEKLQKLTEQARKDLNNSDWSPREAFDSYKTKSGADYSSKPDGSKKIPLSEIPFTFIPYGPREPHIQNLMKQYGITREEAEQVIQREADRYCGIHH